MQDYEQADANLIELIRSRDEEAFDALRLRYESALRRHLQSITHDSDAAEDLLQETLLRLWTHAEQWDGRGAVKGWLFRIATNLGLNSLRTATRRKETPLDGRLMDHDDDSLVPGWMIDSATPGPEAALQEVERMRILHSLVEGLPEEKRELVRLVYESEMELKEAARALGIPEGTAKSRLHYSAKRIAREWREQNDE